MGGGLLQLVAYGAQDLYLTGNPQITFFKAVFRRHTNFAIQSVQQTINGNIKPDAQINFNISRDGDLLSNVILKMTGQTDDSFSCIEYVECEIGGQVIDKQYNLWLNLWCDLTHDVDRTKMLNNLRSGTDSTTTTVTIDQNQPSPAALNNIAVDEIINYTGSENLAPRCIVKHSSGIIYVSKQNGNANKLHRINLDGTIVEDGTSLGFNVQEFDIHDNVILAAQVNGAMISRLVLDNNGMPNQIWAGMVSYDGANAGANNQLIPSIVNGVETIGYYVGDLNSITLNENMILVASTTTTDKIVSRLYLNEDQHYQGVNYSLRAANSVSSTISGILTNNGNGFTDGDGSVAQLTNTTTNAYAISHDDSFMIIVDSDKGIARKINLVSGNYETTTVIGDITQGDVDQRGVVDGGLGAGKIQSVYSIDITSDNRYVLFGDGSALRQLDLNDNTISTLNSSLAGGGSTHVGISIHPNQQYVLMTEHINPRIVKVELSGSYNSSIWFGNGANADGASSLYYPWLIKIAGSGNYVVTGGGGAGSGLFRYFDINAQPHPTNGAWVGAGLSGSYPRHVVMSDVDDFVYIYGSHGASQGIYRYNAGTDPSTYDSSNIAASTLVVGYGLTGGQTGLVVDRKGHNLYWWDNSTKQIRTVSLVQETTFIPNYYFKQHISTLTDNNGVERSVQTMKLADNNDVYIFLQNTPGLYKVSAGADRENTPMYLCTGSEVIERGNGILIHTDGTIYLSCKQTKKIYKYKDDVFTHIAGSGTEGHDNNTNPLEATFSNPRGLCITNYNDLLICDDDNTNPERGDLRVMGGYKPVTITTTVSNPEPSYVPLQFWFCRNPGLALPLIALQYHEVKINVKLAESLNNITYIEAWGDYIYLDTDERRRFAQISHEYLIEQTQFSNRLSLGEYQITNSTAKEVSSIEELRFNHPVKELVWTIEQVNVDENLGKASACSIFNNGGTQSIRVDKALMQFNGSDRFYERDGKYFGDVQRYQKHTGAGLRTTRLGVGSNDLVSNQVTSKWYPKVSSVQVYSFALNPEEHQPSSTCNFSRLDNAIIKNTFKTASHNGTYRYFLNVFAHNYNVLRIMSGMGGLAYSN